MRGERPGTQNEAVTTLGYARQMLRRGWVWGLLAAISTFVVVLAIELLIQRRLTTTSFILAGGIGVGVGLAVGGRSQARRLHEHAGAVLAQSSIE